MSHHKPDPNKSVNLTIDGLSVAVPEGTTILEAARKVNVEIPTLCDHPDLRRRAVCRLCVVECDGRGKLYAACANDVWEGAAVVTNNARIVGIRKTIIELMLANHPQECLNCVRSTKCELQSLAERFGIRTTPFRRDALKRGLSEIACDTLVRDMDKCIKCGRCVDVCQEIQTVRAINTSHRSVHYDICPPYGHTLEEGPCIFCGHCATVCPVGAIFEHDHSAEVWEALGDNSRYVVAEIAPQTTAAIAGEMGLPSETVTAGKIITALKRMGFDQVYDADLFADLSAREKIIELLGRLKYGGKLPMISCCSPGGIKFIEKFFPELKLHLTSIKNPQQNFAYLTKGIHPKVTSVSVMPCIAKKFGNKKPETSSVNEPDFVLTPREFAGMIRLAGIDFDTLPENHFDAFNAASGKSGIPEGTKVRKIVINGLGEARDVLDAIRRDKCDADLVEILSCPSNHFAGGGETADECTISRILR